MSAGLGYKPDESLIRITALTGIPSSRQTSSMSKNIFFGPRWHQFFSVGYTFRNSRLTFVDWRTSDQTWQGVDTHVKRKPILSLSRGWISLNRWHYRSAKRRGRRLWHGTLHSNSTKWFFS